MQDEQRPWIKVDPETVGALSLFDAGGKPYGFLYVTFKLTNVGKRPAFNVQLLLWGFVPRKDHDVLTAEKDRCGKAEIQPLDNPNRGAVIFLGDHVLDSDLTPPGKILAGVSPEDITQSIKEGDGKTFQLEIFGCANYTFEVGARERNLPSGACDSPCWRNGCYWQ
jgi:hypothetical protein